MANLRMSKKKEKGDKRRTGLAPGSGIFHENSIFRRSPRARCCRIGEGLVLFT